ncbi:hypothetical protein Clacol_001640 [Clathrus columnatus]|uniref:Mitochondrial distribution and morphology protein 10 n=1 Tax=Clathrus columnatus TaxID=1419009 RepID=A0AAV5A459_9AGAM|nr:hypothetical protein Clacol_001640 [Clathrus columnatus]
MATGWNDDNLYANLTRASTAILDFTIPRGLTFCVSKSPNAVFNTTCSMTALPTLNGSIGYIFTSHELSLPKSGDVEFQDVVDRFKVYTLPHRPETGGGESTAGKRIRDYLMYGRLYIPSGRLDALSTVRFTPTLQGIIAGISDLPINVSTRDASRSYDKYEKVNSSNLMLSLQHDTGRWCSEYTWSAEDMMFGIRVLRNFGRLGGNAEEARLSWRSEGRRADEENGIEGSLGGRLSAGAELYFSALEKSAGGSTGVRFTTLPDIPTDSVCSQPPVSLTAIFNPMMGYISTAYAAQVSQDLALCSRFNFNVYSYESEWTVGSEWWVRKGVPENIDWPSGESSVPNDLSGHQSQEIQGVVKARMSTKMDISFLWEGRIQNVLMSLGFMSDLSGGSKPIRAVGIELSYFSSD